MFNDLLAKLHDTKPQPNPLYYHLLIENADIILLEVAKRNQGVVAKDLKMSLTKFSAIMSVLREYA